MNKVNKAIKACKDNNIWVDCGIFDCRNIVGDTMETEYKDEDIQIDVCWNYDYIEIFGLTDNEFKEFCDRYEEAHTEKMLADDEEASDVDNEETSDRKIMFVSFSAKWDIDLEWRSICFY